ncbi:unnamed protein product [Macrosiphum euphorbiae]|uniref:Uncharacterized protein n=1 Tax=Macrosiphum euphorbiae TaxID=13131 RepID=A0AAV0WEB2_9HEMI|nr:unnamed protein product [Macrosiphum euphorbiae]
MEKKRAHTLYKCSRSPYDYSAFSKLRAKYKHQSKIDYQSYIKNTKNSFNRNPSLFWKSIKNLNQKNTVPQYTLRWNSDTVDNPLGSANLFSKYFYYMYNNSISSPVNISNTNIIPYELPSNCHFKLDDVQLALNSLKNTNSNGPDGISACLLFNCQDSIVYPFFLLFGLSLVRVSFQLLGKHVLSPLFLNLEIPRSFLITGLFPSYHTFLKCLSPSYTPRSKEVLTIFL